MNPKILDRTEEISVIFNFPVKETEKYSHEKYVATICHLS